MKKVFIVDDEPRAINVLSSLLHKHFPEIALAGTATNVNKAIAEISDTNPDIVLLDISMPQKDGFALLEAFPHHRFAVIFVTAHAEHAIRAFRFSAADYLLKPVDDELFVSAIEKVLQSQLNASPPQDWQTLHHNIKHMDDQSQMRMCISSTKGFRVLRLSEILRLEGQSCYTIFTLLNNEKITSSKTLSEYEEMLSAAGFLRVHKSHLINLNEVKEYLKGEGGEAVMNNGERVEISRRKKEQFVTLMKRQVLH